MCREQELSEGQTALIGRGVRHAALALGAGVVVQFTLRGDGDDYDSVEDELSQAEISANPKLPR